MMRPIPTMLLALLLAAARPAAADLLLLDEDFSFFDGTGLAPVGRGPLDSRSWAVLGLSDGDSTFGDTRLDGDFARGLSPGGERSGGLHAFALPGALRGLGVQATGSDFTPGSLLRRVENTAGVALGGLLVLFDLWVLNDGERSTRLLFDAHRDPALTAGLRDEAATRLTPAAADDRGWQPLSVQAQFLDLGIPDRGEVILRWLFEDAAGGGSRDEFALSRVRVQGLPAAASLPGLPVPDPVPGPGPGPEPILTLAGPPSGGLALAALALAAVARTARRRRAAPAPLPIGNGVATPPPGGGS